MRPIRLLLSLATGLLAVTLLLYLVYGSNNEDLHGSAASAEEKGTFRSLLSFTSPASLFPPSAIISLTDDNSTFFLARPAAFGPRVPADSLSGPLWAGSGFGDEEIGRHSELGCSDVPDGNDDPNELRPAVSDSRKSSEDGKEDHQNPLTKQPHAVDITERSLTGSDETDSHLRSRQPAGSIAKYRIGKTPEHAEISGKIVLLKRGGCGFLEKVMWAQKRGGIALIVGDNVRGGALVQMYARGDTSNVTIPALFTSHTTAHLLSSLLTTADLAPGLIRGLSGLGSATTRRSPTNQQASASQKSSQSRSEGWFTRFSSRKEGNSPVNSSTASSISDPPEDDKPTGPHEGLWVTLTPTSMSASPLFDTLLVLVVSPLVTLTVVYALLLLRSRIRRRRWRAPKSLVDRLPVRTYHTISDSSPSATPDASSPTTPLLQHDSSRPSSAHSRPRSQAGSEVPATSSSARQEHRTPEEEKRESGLAAWRRRYGGRQKECVVCLEEYVDGVSQVMSLPCGHEFHAECITPWLVTRRRTCPICKGDVVRSLSHSYHERTGSQLEAVQVDEDEDDIQAQAAGSRNDSPSASRPLGISSDHIDEDIEANWTADGEEHGRDIPGERSDDASNSVSSSAVTAIWRGFEAVGRATGIQRRSSRGELDRDR